MKKSASTRIQTTNKLENDASSNLPVYVETSIIERRGLERSSLERWWRYSTSFESADEKKDDDVRDRSIQSRTHYRIKSKRSYKKGFWKGLKDCTGCFNQNAGSLSFEQWVGVPGSLDINHLITHYLSWCFKTSFAVLFVSLLVFFFMFILLFSFLMMIVGNSNPACFEPTFGNEGTPFEDAYALSWTTFTTVGYGHSFPEHGKGSMDADGSYSEDHGYRVCFWLQFLCTLEAFVGVVFSSICGALIFAKVVRIQALAPVLFSDPMIVRYGPGVQKAFCKDCPSGKIPCPVLSFRLANVYSNRQGGELIDTKLKLKAIFHNGKGDLNLEEGDSKSSEHMILDENPNNYEEEEDDISICMVKQSSVIIEEDPGSNFDVQRTFLSIDVDSAENPYFKRIWTVNHVLDQKSPLIVPHVQRRILENQGYWPAYLNDAESVRASINFDQIFVELDGISVVSADKVYAQHMYNYTDMNIGFEFMPVLYRSARKGLNIRYDMLGDVTEQKGGGSEDFVPDDDPRELGAMRNFSGNLQIMKLDD